jgi:hypothetical protein
MSLALVALVAACETERSRPLAPVVPAGPGLPMPPPSLIVDAEWVMYDWRPDPDCERDATGTVHIDAAARTFTLSTCAGTKVRVNRTLGDRELAAISALLARLPTLPPTITLRPSKCPHIRWRDGDGEHLSSLETCTQGEEADAVVDLIELFAGLRDAGAVCGGPASIPCDDGRACGERQGLVPYAFGRCQPDPSMTPTILCTAIAYCSEGWRESTLLPRACAARGTCRWMSARCGDERLCEKCGPGDTCRGGPPLPD